MGVRRLALFEFFGGSRSDWRSVRVLVVIFCFVLVLREGVFLGFLCIRLILVVSADFDAFIWSFALLFELKGFSAFVSSMLGSLFWDDSMSVCSSSLIFQAFRAFSRFVSVLSVVDVLLSAFDC